MARTRGDSTVTPRSGSARDLEPRHPHALAVVAAAVVLVVTGALSYVVWGVNDRNEDRLLRRQLRQAGSALMVVGGSIQLPLLFTLQGTAAAGDHGAAFTSLMAGSVGPDRLFVSAALWRFGSPKPIVVLGKRSALESRPADAVQRFLVGAASSPRFSVIALRNVSPPRVGYAVASMATPVKMAVYAETELPEHPTSVRAVTDPYRGVDFHIYLGQLPTMSHLLAASSRRLPFAGRHASVSIPFGNTHLLVVFTPQVNLGGWLLANLWWIIVVGGVILAASVAIVADRLSRQRRAAAMLARQNESLYAEQRGIALTLQESLLPRLPILEQGMEVAARYRPAATYAEVGGDWYDVVTRTDGSLVLVVGDVAGHGIESAATMAELRFAARAYAMEGHGPATILTKLGALVNTREVGFFATVLCMEFGRGERSLVVANAGHPRPLLVDTEGAHFVDAPPQPPVGLPVTRYSETEAHVRDTGMLLAFTDGLFERPGEALDVGLERVRRAALDPSGPLDQLLDRIIDEVSVDSHTDDIVTLGLRWHHGDDGETREVAR